MRPEHFSVEARGLRLSGLDAWEADCLAELLADCAEPRVKVLAGALEVAALAHTDVRAVSTGEALTARVGLVTVPTA